ncbi:MAG: isochorismatase family cysteine hydrolase [Candidatus Falkowbacteria bacterium]
MRNRALIVVDMLNDFVDPRGALYFPSASDIVPYVKVWLKKARTEKDLIVFLCDSHKKDDLEFQRFPEHCVAGTWGAEIVPELTPNTAAWRTGGGFEYVVKKSRYSGFFQSNLEHILKKHLSGVPSWEAGVEVVGVCTSICVMDTVGGLANRDYRILVPHHGVADFDNHAHEMALARMEKLYGANIV